jgi:cation transport ATPase
MAVSATPLSSTLVVRYQTGTTTTGSPELRQKSLNDVKADSMEQDVYDVAVALFSLGQHPVINVFLKKNFELLNQ